MWPFKSRIADAPPPPEAPPARRWEALNLPPSEPGKADISMADALQNTATGLGGDRDKRFYSDYAYAPRLSDWQLRSRYRSSWLAAAIVNTPIEDMVREWVTRKWKDQTPEEVAALKRSEVRVALKSKAREGLTWGALFGGGAIIPVIEGQDDFSQPLVLDSIKKGSLQALIVKDRSRILPAGGLPDLDFASPNYGKPLFYQVIGVGGSSLRVHWSRVVRFEGRLAPEYDFVTNNYWHDSELQHVDTALKDFDGAIENVAAMMWEAKIDVIKTSLAQMIAAKDGGAAIQKRYLDAALGKGNHRILLLNKDEEYDSKSFAFGGVHDLLGDFVVFACGAARIPMVKLFGQSAPGMNSTGTVDEGLYYDRIASDQEWKMLPAIARLDEIMLRDALGRMPEEYELVANPLEQVSPKDQADIELKEAQRDVALLGEGAITVGMIARRLKTTGSYSGIMTDEDVKTIEEMDEPLPAAVPGSEPATPLPPKKGQPPAPGLEPAGAEPGTEPTT